jgi:hypothetical protein
MSPTGSLLLVLLHRAEAAEPRRAPRASVGAHLGASFSLSGLGASVAPGLQGTVVIDRGARLEALLGVSYADGLATGTGSDPAFEEPFTWNLKVSNLAVAPGLHVRILPWSERISPVIAAGPSLDLGVATTSGSAGAANFPDTTERYVGFGGWARAGVAGHVGPGSLEVGLTYAAHTTGADLVGAPLIHSLTPSILYRFER